MNGYDSNDTLNGNTGNDMLIGGLGNDVLKGGSGNDQLHGNEGNDVLDGSYGNDILTGGTGNDLLSGGDQVDTYVFDTNHGLDAIDDKVYSSSSDKNIIKLTHISNPSAIDFTHISNTSDLIIKTSADDQITLKHYFSNGSYKYDRYKVEFNDGSQHNISELIDNVIIDGSEVAETLNGTKYDDVMNGYDSNDTLNGNTGNDMLIGGLGNDVLKGESGNDQLHGNEGNDVLDGSSGNDVLVGGLGVDQLIGGSGSDTYKFDQNFGADTISNIGNNSGDADSMIFSDKLEEFSFELMNNDLMIKNPVGGDSVTIKDWNSLKATFDKIQFIDGSLLSSQIELLIQEMAAFNTTHGVSWNDMILIDTSEYNEFISNFLTVSNNN